MYHYSPTIEKADEERSKIISTTNTGANTTYQISYSDDTTTEMGKPECSPSCYETVILTGRPINK